MAIQGVTYNNQRVSAADHASLFQMFITDGKLNGCGISTRRNTLTITSGSFIVAGRLTKIVGSETITIPEGVTSTSKKLIGVCDMGQTAQVNSFGQFYFKLEDSSYTLKKEDINTGNGQYYEVEWSTLTIDSEGNITAHNDTFPEAGNSGGGGGSNFISDSDYTFTGDPNKLLYSSSGTDWEIIILEAATATLNFTKRPGNVDIFMVSAGGDGNGGTNGASSYSSTSGNGGNGGERVTSTETILNSGAYTVTVGTADENADHDTSICVSGSEDPIVKAYRANGGHPASGNGATHNSSADDGGYAFGDADGVINTTYKSVKYGAGGGQGAVYKTSTLVASTVGGATGGGSGAAYIPNESNRGGDASPNTGSGGGGGRSAYIGNMYYGTSGGFGGSGIIIIRNHRTTPAA